VELPDTANTLAALKSIRGARPDGAPIYVILDNLSAHKGKEIRAWAARNKVELCFTPTYASWANPIGAHFGPLRSFVIAGSDHANHCTLTPSPAQILALAQQQRPPSRRPCGPQGRCGPSSAPHTTSHKARARSVSQIKAGGCGGQVPSVGRVSGRDERDQGPAGPPEARRHGVGNPLPGRPRTKPEQGLKPSSGPVTPGRPWPGAGVERHHRHVMTTRG